MEIFHGLGTSIDLFTTPLIPVELMLIPLESDILNDNTNHVISLFLLCVCRLEQK